MQYTEIWPELRALTELTIYTVYHSAHRDTSSTVDFSTLCCLGKKTLRQAMSEIHTVQRLKVILELSPI